MNGFPILFLLILCAGSLGAAAQAAPLIAPEGARWSVGSGLDFGKKVRRSVSGIACPAAPVAGSRCLLALDEGIDAATVILGDGELRPDGAAVALLDEGRELDGEAAASDGAFTYVAGSHAAKRSDCRANPDSHHVIRLPHDANGGLVPAGPDGAAGIARASLDGVIAGLPALAPFLDACLGEDGGVDIEGLAVSGDRLFFGFRGPVDHGKALVLSLGKAAFFEGKPSDAQLLTVDLGGGRAVRDMQAVQGGLLILAGPGDGDQTAGFGLSLRRDDGTVVPLAELDLSGVTLGRHGACKDVEIKPEALAVLDDAPDHFRVLVLSDGLCDGGPMSFRVPR